MRERRAYLAALSSLSAQGKLADTLELIRRSEKQTRLIPSELVLKGGLIQLTPDDGTYELSDAEAAFVQALELDPDYIPALIELGSFYYSVEDNPAKASELFERAVRLGREQLTEAVIGLTGCLEEIRSREEAIKFLQDVKRDALIQEKLDERITWLEKTQPQPVDDGVQSELNRPGFPGDSFP